MIGGRLNGRNPTHEGGRGARWNCRTDRRGNILKAFSDTVRSIYDAALAPELWPAALSKIGGMFDAEGAVVIFYSKDSEADFIYSDELREAVRVYVDEGWRKRDIHAQRALKMHLTVGDVFNDFSVATADEIERLPIFVDFFARVGFGWLMSCMVLPDADVLVLLSVPRAKAKGSFGADEMEQLGLLGRHVEQALRLSLRFADLEADEAMLRTALDAVDAGIYALGSDGHLVYANAAGRGRFSGLFTTVAGRVLPQDEDVRPRFAALVQTASNAEKMSSSPQPCVLTGRDGGKTVVWALPVTETGRQHIGAGPAAQVLLLAVPIAGDHPVDPTLVRDAFNLTLGEARLAALIGSGTEVREAAAKLGVTEGTVRVVLKRVFRKLGINRQSQLVLQLSSLRQGRYPASPAARNEAAQGGMESPSRLAKE